MAHRCFCLLSVFVFIFVSAAAFGASPVPVASVHQEGVSMEMEQVEVFFGQESFLDDIDIQVGMVSAPNFFGSPSWPGFALNALSSLMAGGGDIGNRQTDPEAYHVLAEFYQTGDIMVTSFNSWRGWAFPDPPFDSESGNRMHCSLSAEGDGTIQFTLSDVLYMFSSNDHLLDFAGTLDGTTYNGATRVGLDYGLDRVKGTGDDILYMSNESGSISVDALYYVGVGNAYWPGGGPVPSGTEQQEIDLVRSYISENDIEVSCGYYIRGNQTVVSVVLEPPFFEDGFESGDTSAWSVTVGE